MVSKMSNDGDETISEINVTPLVDVVLVLLVIFMLTAPVMYQSAIKVSLPSAQTGERSEKKLPLTFSITDKGELFWNDDLLTWKQLETRLISMGNSIADQTAVVSADTNATHGNVIRLMDILRRMGLTRFAMNVQAKQ